MTSMIGFTYDGEWAPSVGDWLARHLDAKLAEVLCNKCDWHPMEVFALSMAIARLIDESILEQKKESKS